MVISPRMPAAEGWRRIIDGETYWFLPDGNGVIVYRFTGQVWGRWEVMHVFGEGV